VRIGAVSGELFEVPQEDRMKLTLPEKIQLLRKRMGLNQGQFGAKAFDMSVETGRTKIKNIELGKQKPTPDDLVRMAEALNVPESILQQVSVNEDRYLSAANQGMVVDQAVLDRFQRLGDYLEMLNRAVSIKDEELIDHIAGKLSGVFVFKRRLEAMNN
jgi:transcriptional regulator with XRE-family HTH domain